MSSLAKPTEILPDDGTATLFTVSETLGYHFWIDEDAVFMSAPSYATGGGCDMDNAIAVERLGKL